MSARRSLVLVAAAALLVRVVLLVLRGDYIVYDEGYYLLLARSLRAHGTFALNGLPHVSLSPLQPLVVALLSLTGLGDLWLSRLLAAGCGALLVFPVAALARRAAGERAAFAAGLLVAVSPALLTFLPFFPGQVWNLYFGSEPLFLLLAFGACAAAAAAAERGTLRWFLVAGAACAGAFLARAEGVVLGPLVMLVLAIFVALRRERRAWLAWAAAAMLGVALAAPYLLYLHGTLGRWAFSGRVQAMTGGAAPAPATLAAARQGGDVLDEFVWGGAEAQFRAQLYGLTPDGLRLQSQYWGVDRTPPESLVAAPIAPAPRAAAAAAPPPDSAAGQAGAPPRASFARTLLRGILVVVPWWLGAVALLGYAAAWRAGRELLWLVPPLVAALLPAFAAYVEPRSLLPLAPLAAIGAALGWARGTEALARTRRAPGWLGGLVLAAVAGALLVPTVRAAARSWRNDTPLQRVATAQRAVGAYLAAHLPPPAAVMSWHPGVAVYAHRDWRVLPAEPVDRVLRYAQARGVGTIVFSRFHPTPLGDTPRPFMVVLVDPTSDVRIAGTLRLEQVDDTPLLFVGRLPRRAP